MRKELNARLKNSLLDIYNIRASNNRINELAKRIVSIINNTNKSFDEIVYLVDEFEGGVSDAESFESIFAFITGELTVNKENAQRLFDFFQHCQNKDVYIALTSRFFDFLTEEQKSILPPTCPSLYSGKP